MRWWPMAQHNFFFFFFFYKCLTSAVVVHNASVQYVVHLPQKYHMGMKPSFLLAVAQSVSGFDKLIVVFCWFCIFNPDAWSSVQLRSCHLSFNSLGHSFGRRNSSQHTTCTLSPNIVKTLHWQKRWAEYLQRCNGALDSFCLMLTEDLLHRKKQQKKKFFLTTKAQLESLTQVSPYTHTQISDFRETECP